MARTAHVKEETFNIERTPERRSREIPRTQSISLWAGRLILENVPEYTELQRYQWNLAVNNGGIYETETGQLSMQTERRPLDDKSTVMRPVQGLHITHIEARFINDIMDQKYGQDRKKYLTPKQKRGMLRHAAKNYREYAKRSKEKELDTLQHVLGDLSERRGYIGFDEPKSEAQRMNSGRFSTILSLGAFGLDGFENQFGLRFSEQARDYLRHERDMALINVTGSLGIDINRDIDDETIKKFYMREPHVTLIEFGKKSEDAPNWIVKLPLGVDGDVMSPPRSFVTELNPKASVIIRDAV